MKEAERQTQNYVDSDTESRQNSKPNYVFSVGDRLGQRSGIVTVVVGGVHSQMSLLTQGRQPFRPRNLGVASVAENPVSDPKGGQSLISL